MRAILLSLLLFTSCSSAAARRELYIPDYLSGRPEQAIEYLDPLVEQKVPNGNYQKSPDSALLLLERGQIKFASEDYQGAISDFKLAIEALDFYNQYSSPEKLERWLISDECGAYPAPDFEQLLARFYFTLALLQIGDESNACAILRQAEELQQTLTSSYQKQPLFKHLDCETNPALKYLFALLLEKKGDKSNAKILYEQAEKLSPLENSGHGTSSILFICHNGNAPIKNSYTSPASCASLAALEFMFGRPPAISSTMGIALPKLCYWYGSDPYPIEAMVDGQLVQLKTVYDVAEASENDLEKRLPFIAARAVGRLISRRAAIECVARQDPQLGALLDIGMLAANAATKADTRGWCTLPWTIDMSRFNTSSGSHELYIKTPFETLGPFAVHLQAGKLTTINIFNFHPGITRVLIPSHSLGDPLCFGNP